MRSFVIILVLLVLGLVAMVQAESLREEIRGKVMIKSTFYDRENLDPSTFDDAFNGSATNITTPEQIWQTLPSWLRYTFGAIIIAVGIVITFWGVRFLPLSVFLIGGFIAAVILYVILAVSVPNDNSQKTAIVYGSTLGMWVVAGILLAFCVKLAVFILGASLGAITALVLNPIALKYVWPAEPLANMIIWMVIFGLIGGAIACFLERPLLLLATAAGGAFAIVASSMGMAGTLSIAALPINGSVVSTNWQDWAGFAGFLALTTFGFLVQLCITAVGSGPHGYSKLD